MAKINIDFNNIIGEIKPMHAVGQPPFLGIDYSNFSYLKEASIPYSRLHDVGGGFGGFRYVDIPNVFRDFDADENDPAAYDFAFTDLLITALMEHDCPPVFRLGVTIENYRTVKAYRIYPPTDFAKWARICEHIIRHYNEGWADGFYYDIKYWEIWNEPENGLEFENQMWLGTDEEFFELYTASAKHLKACFGDSIKVGGYGSCGFSGIWANPEKYGMNIPKQAPHPDMEKEVYRVEFLYGFLKYIKEHDAPLDFFSWHSYSVTQKTLIMADFLDKVLNEFGYGDVETHLNEWNNARDKEMRGTSYAAAKYADMMLSMQNKKTNMLCFYDAQIGISQYGGMFNPLTKEPYCAYYSFKAFGHLYKLKNQVECTWDDEDLYAVAAADGENRAIMISNSTDEDKKLELPFDVNYIVYLVDEENLLAETELNPARFTLKKNQVALIVNKLL